MLVKHVFFDLDHTLWDFDVNSKKAYALCFDTHNVKASLDDFIAHYEPINLNYWKLYREEKVTKEVLKYGRLRDSFNAINHRISDRLIDQLAGDYLVYLPTFNQLFEGTFDILDYLKPKYKLHIITNGFSEIQLPKLINSGILKYFDQIITSDKVGVKKPNSKVFHYAMEQANTKPQHSVMIGDSWEADVLGAKQVGMDAIFFNPKNQHITTDDKVIKRLVEIKNYL